MRYKKIPNTNLEVSVIALGAWAFGKENWGDISDAQCIDVVSACIDCGINLIDTAPIYGYGKSEEIVGKAIRGRREKFIISTKCGLKGKGAAIRPDLQADSIKNEIEESLKRLKIDYIDIYHCHHPDPNTPIEETIGQMNKLKQEGKIKYIAVSNFDIDLLKKASQLGNIVFSQSHYSLLERSIEDKIIPYCKEKGIFILSYGSLGGGILSGKYTKPAAFKGPDARSFFYKYYDEKGFAKASKIADKVKQVAAKINKPPAEVALNWICLKDFVASAIVGCKTVEQVRQNAQAGAWQLSQEDIEMLK
ncbi:MAG: aldo/keto reductase [Candidatus Omnitrophota bacterium]